jgi:hypothetical protein
MLSSKVFFSFTEVLDPTRHGDYNAWHQLDHRPENLALPGVLHGERWVRSPDCAAAAPRASDGLEGVHYVNMYWFREPVDESFREWQALAERSFQWGRRPDADLARRPMMGSFSPVKGYVSPRVLVCADALPFRPNLGVALTVSRVVEPHGTRAHERFAWYDRELIPDLLASPGVAGVWTFSSQSTTLDPGWRGAGGSTTFDEASQPETGQYRILLAYLDADPLAFLAGRRPGLGSDGPHPESETSIMDGVLRSITPWEWTWFDEEPP